MSNRFFPATKDSEPPAKRRIWRWIAARLIPGRKSVLTIEAKLLDGIRKPAIRLLVEQIFGSRILSVADYREAKRLNKFFQALDRDEILLKDDVIQSEEFLDRLDITQRAVKRTVRTEKINAFANLLATGSLGPSAVEFSEYEMLLGILDELSLRELEVLVAIERYEEKHYRNGSFAGGRSEWLLHAEVADVWGVEPSEVSDSELMGIVVRLERTGCYFSGGWRHGPAHDCRLTDLYWKLRRLLGHQIRKDSESSQPAAPSRPKVPFGKPVHYSGRVVLYPSSSSLNVGQLLSLRCEMEGLPKHPTLASFTLVILWKETQLRFIDIRFGDDLGEEEFTAQEKTLLQPGVFNPSDPSYSAIVFGQQSSLPGKVLADIQADVIHLATLKFECLTTDPIQINPGTPHGGRSFVASQSYPVATIGASLSSLMLNQ